MSVSRNRAAMPRGRGWPKPGRTRISVRYGPPLHPEPGEAARQFTSRVQHAIARLWDEDETTWWESLRREHSAEGTAVPTGPDAPS